MRPQITQTSAARKFFQYFSARSPRFCSGLWLFLAAMAMGATGLPAYAVTRNVTISAPTTAVAGSKVSVTVSARTDAGNGEQIGFFHADYSTDGGATWVAISYSKNAGASATYSTSFTVKQADSKAIVRVRVAFRGGKAGDVDYTGKVIDWDGSWNNWEKPPAKDARIAILAK